MRMMQDRGGSVSVFLLLFISAFFIFWGVWVEGLRVESARSQFTRSLSLSAESAMTNYQGRLKKYYSLFALAHVSDDALKEEMNRYFRANIGASGTSNKETFGATFVPFTFGQTDIFVTREHPLDRPEVLWQQILSQNKAFLTEELAKGGAERVLAFEGMWKEARAKWNGYSFLSGNTDAGAVPFEPDFALSQNPVLVVEKNLKAFFTANKVTPKGIGWVETIYPKELLPSGARSDVAPMQDAIKVEWLSLSGGSRELFGGALGVFLAGFSTRDPEHVLAAQYMISSFKNGKSALTPLQKDLNGYLMLKRPFFFKGGEDAEYIVSGRGDPLENMKLIRQLLLLARLPANARTFFEDPYKVMLAQKVGALLKKDAETLESAVAKVVHAWVIWESILDVSALSEGRELRLLKEPAEWVVSADVFGKMCRKESFTLQEQAWIIPPIETPMEATKETTPTALATAGDEGLIRRATLKYADYLLIFSHLVPKSSLLMRTADMIQLNLQKMDQSTAFLLRTCYTKIQARGVGSVPLLFIHRLPGFEKLTRGGRLMGSFSENWASEY